MAGYMGAGFLAKGARVRSRNCMWTTLPPSPGHKGRRCTCHMTELWALSSGSCQSGEETSKQALSSQHRGLR